MPDEIVRPNLEMLAQALWARSPAFRQIYASFSKLRFGPGDCTIVLGAYADSPGISGPVIYQEEIGITMSWAQLKALATQLTDAVRAVEKEMGEFWIYVKVIFANHDDISAIVDASTRRASKARQRVERRE